MKKFFGGMLCVTGGLIALGSGLCSLTTMLAAVVNAFAMLHGLHDIPAAIGALFGSLVMVALVGVIPFLIGIALFKMGQRMIQQAGEGEAQTKKETDSHDQPG
ncbi:MAG: hypothetical protein GC185_02535 [Alphaproteobacteria bacterium]|nr:hypothetical protein [Alphaproteobacteria bacterium]